MSRTVYLASSATVLVLILLSISITRIWGPRVANAPGQTFAASRPPALGLDQAATGSPRPKTLYCQFYVFVETRPFVAFLFERAPKAAQIYRQVSVTKADGDLTDYDAERGVRPEWRFDATTEPPRLAARVTVPDQSQAGVGQEDIAIEVHGFNATHPGGAWYEASLRSVHYQNLPGKCRQT